MIWIVTSPERIHEEAGYLNGLLIAGADVLLLRKPGWPEREYAALLDQLHDHSRVMITGHPALLQQYPVMGLHVSEAARPGFDTAAAHAGVLSTSIHVPVSPGEQWRYLLLGPVFDSISKAGYTGRGHLFADIPPNSIAIGGVQADNIHAVKSKGFRGAALLGAIWNNPSMAVQNLKNIRRLWEHSS